MILTLIIAQLINLANINQNHGEINIMSKYLSYSLAFLSLSSFVILAVQPSQAQIPVQSGNLNASLDFSRRNLLRNYRLDGGEVNSATLNVPNLRTLGGSAIIFNDINDSDLTGTRPVGLATETIPATRFTPSFPASNLELSGVIAGRSLFITPQAVVFNNSATPFTLQTVVSRVNGFSNSRFPLLSRNTTENVNLSVVSGSIQPGTGVTIGRNNSRIANAYDFGDRNEMPRLISRNLKFKLQGPPSRIFPMR